MILLGIALVGCIALLAAGLVLFTLYTAHRVERALPPRGRFLDIGGARLHYLDEGKGPAIVMIHGLGGQMAHFTYALLDQLKQDFRVVLFDRPGSGYSRRPRGASAQLRAQGEVIGKAIEALKLDKPLLVGHSMGGGVALSIALDHPELVRGAALIAPLTHPVAEPPAAFEALAIKSDARRRLISWTLATPMSILRQRQILARYLLPIRFPAISASERAVSWG
jgi:pimeloyl-ACP methyl ester carboxylesterase